MIKHIQKIACNWFKGGHKKDYIWSPWIIFWVSILEKKKWKIRVLLLCDHKSPRLEQRRAHLHRSEVWAIWENSAGTHHGKREKSCLTNGPPHCAFVTITKKAESNLCLRPKVQACWKVKVIAFQTGPGNKALRVLGTAAQAMLFLCGCVGAVLYLQVVRAVVDNL